MSAADTAFRVIEWATVGAGFPPMGDAHDAEELARPGHDLAEAIGRLTALTAARLRLAPEFLGDRPKLGPGTALIAAAIGTREARELSGAFLAALPPAKDPAEWLARHGLVGACLEFDTTEMGDELRRASPLTALLDRPAPGRVTEVLGVANAFIAHRAGRLFLQNWLAVPVTQNEVRRWRLELMERMRSAGEAGIDFVLDIYETAMSQHETEVLAQVHLARGILRDPEAAADDTALDSAMSIADWWGPLWALDRSHRPKLRARRYLGYEYRQGIGLYNLAKRTGIRVP